jgi:AraC-like DNA-binding protein
MQVTEPPQSFRFSTGGLPLDQRLLAYRDLFSGILANFRIDTLQGDFCCNARYRRLPDLSIVDVASSPVRASWQRVVASNGDRDIALMLSGVHSSTVGQSGCEADVPAGGAILVSATDPVSITRKGYTYLLVPKRLLAPVTADIDKAFLKPVDGTSETMRLLKSYLRSLIRLDQPLPPMLAMTAAEHVRDLLALAIGASREGEEIASGRGLRAARLRALKADIANNLHSGDVSIGALAARHRMSPRYVQKLFESEGTTLSKFVLELRLAYVRRLLADPRYAGFSIGSIVYEAGFGDLSTFNRSFRARYGATPSDIRAEALLCVRQ